MLFSPNPFFFARIQNIHREALIFIFYKIAVSFLKYHALKYTK